MRVRPAGDRDTYEGTPLEIITTMKSRAIFLEQLSVSEFLARMVSQLPESVARTVDLSVGSEEQKCDTLIQTLVAHGLAERLDE